MDRAERRRQERTMRRSQKQPHQEESPTSDVFLGFPDDLNLLQGIEDVINGKLSAMEERLLTEKLTRDETIKIAIEYVKQQALSVTVKAKRAKLSNDPEALLTLLENARDLHTAFTTAGQSNYVAMKKYFSDSADHHIQYGDIVGSDRLKSVGLKFKEMVTLIPNKN